MKYPVLNGTNNRKFFFELDLTEKKYKLNKEYENFRILTQIMKVKT